MTKRKSRHPETGRYRINVQSGQYMLTELPTSKETVEYFFSAFKAFWSIFEEDGVFLA